MTPMLHALHFQPWLITPETHAAMLRASSRVELFSQDSPEPPEPDLLSVENGVGIVTIHGALMKRPDFFARLLLGATDMEDVAAALETARDRADVQAVFLDVDSPGGTVNGTPELAALVADVSKAKYTYAFTDGQMCSAAYWIASQADAIFATPSARVGSIGVEGTALTEEQRAWIQTQVDETYADF